MPITVAARSKAWTVFARSNAWIVGSNPTQGMDVCIACVYSVFVLGWSPLQEVLPTVYMIKQLKKAAKTQQRAVEP
jgi:hypothetical protein